MKATSVLLYQLAMTYCTTLSSETQEAIKDKSSQVAEEKAPVDGNLFLKIKQESNIRIDDTDFEAPYYLNRMRFKQALLHLNELRNIPFEDKIYLISNFIKFYPRDEGLFLSPDALIPHAEMLYNVTPHAGMLYNELYYLGIIERFFITLSLI